MMSTPSATRERRLRIAESLAVLAGEMLVVAYAMGRQRGEGSLPYRQHAKQLRGASRKVAQWAREIQRENTPRPTLPAPPKKGGGGHCE
jgi:hypothetical protein